MPPGDYEVSFDELRNSVLAHGPVADSSPRWDKDWRRRLIDNLEVLTRQLWSIGIREVYADGSFVEDKDHPNDIDGYFVCELQELASGELARQLNLLDPHKGLDVGPGIQEALSGIPEEATPHVAPLSC